MRKLFLVLASFLLSACPAFGQEKAAAKPTPAGTLTDEQLAARTVEATMQWEKSTTHGIKAAVHLLRKSEAKVHQVVEYRLKISGAPHNQLYTMMVWPVTTAAPVAMMDGLVVAQDGTVGCPADSTKSCAQRFKGKELLLTYAPARGEIYRHALISQDQKSRVFFSIVPEPIVQKDKACSLEAVRLSPNFELVVVRGKGFQPGEEISFHEQSYQEVHNVQTKADAHGEFHAQLTPFVKGRTSGTAEVVARGKGCAPAVSFEWGH